MLSGGRSYSRQIIHYSSQFFQCPNHGNIAPAAIPLPDIGIIQAHQTGYIAYWFGTQKVYSKRRVRKILGQSDFFFRQTIT
jgi:hypothetical protein